MMLSTRATQNKTILFSGLTFFVIHTLYSYVFFKERMLNEDAPFYLMQLIQHGKMLCEHYRFSVFLYNWIPLIALKSGASVEFLARIYSIAIDAIYPALFIFS